jgi:hypothetical protein
VDKTELDVFVYGISKPSADQRDLRDFSKCKERDEVNEFCFRAESDDYFAPRSTLVTHQKIEERTGGEEKTGYWQKKAW